MAITLEHWPKRHSVGFLITQRKPVQRRYGKWVPSNNASDIGTHWLVRYSWPSEPGVGSIVGGSEVGTDGSVSVGTIVFSRQVGLRWRALG